MGWKIQIETDGTTAGTKIKRVGVGKGSECVEAAFSIVAEALRKLSVWAVTGRKE